MPKFTIDLTDKALAGIQAEVSRYNANAGTALTVADWIDLHLREIAIGPDLNAALDQLRKQAEADVNAALTAAITAARAELLAALAAP